MAVAFISLLIILVAVYILAIITDHYFVPSLDALATRLDMPSDVAGASLMAMGSSAPELFIALTAVFIGSDHSSVGIGTIVGSAVFNILVITGASAAIAGDMAMQGRSVERDIIFYLGSVAILAWVFWDSQVFLWEALIFIVGYVGYLILLWQWGEHFPEDEAEERAEIVTETSTENPEKVENPSLLGRINGVIILIFGLIARDPEKQYIWAMLVSIAAIAGISFVLVEAAVELSHALSLPPILVSMTLLAAGTSAPDLIASVDVAREGRGEMAIANAVGSDIFDVLVGLGVPWVIGLTLLGQGVITIETEGLITSIFLLSATTVLLYWFLYSERRLTRREGYLLLLAYVIYVGYVYFATQGAAPTV